MKDEIVDQKVMLGIRLVFIIVLLVFLAALTFSVYMLIRDRNQRKQIFKTEAELKSAEDMLRGQDNERERIARELHDRVGSMLSTVKLHFSTMEEQLKDWMSYQGSTYKKTLELIDETYEEVRRISHDLDSGLLSRFGLRTAMLQLAQIIDATNKLKVTYLDTDVDPEWYKPYQTDLYRITQELLSNTIKHAEAKEVSIQLSRTNGSLIYLYEDDGKGFVTDPAEKPKGIGLVNVRTRVSRMKGVLQLDSSPGHGFNLIIELTIHETGTHSDS